VEGQWDDRYMGAGRALSTYQEFERLVQRGSLVRVEFESITVVGLITEADFDYKLASQIGYKFTLSPHSRGSDTGEATRRTAARQDLALPADLVEEVGSLSAGLSAVQAEAPAIQVKGNLVTDALASAEALAREVDAVAVSLTNRVQNALEPLDGLRRVANAFSVVKTRAQEAVASVVSARSDLDMAWDSAVGILDFDVWIRGLGQLGRMALLTSHNASTAITRRADPDPAALYRPSAGESLYAVSQRFYGTPWQWRLIAERNGLSQLTLTGAELLVIPELRRG
jgi:hypothetical protein